MNKDCTTCILDLTDACPRGAGRAVDDEICDKFISECDTCLFSTRKEKVDEAYQKGRADALNEMIKEIKLIGIMQSVYIKIAENLKENSMEKCLFSEGTWWDGFMQAVEEIRQRANDSGVDINNILDDMMGELNGK